MPNNRVLALFSYNEPVLLKNEFQDWLRCTGIRHYTTQTYSPEMNGIAENAIKQIVSRASAMMSTAGIPVGFWPEAVRCSTYISPFRSVRLYRLTTTDGQASIQHNFPPFPTPPLPPHSHNNSIYNNKKKPIAV